MHPSLTLEWLPGRYFVCTLDPAAAMRHLDWLRSSLASRNSALLSVTRTERETSLVLDESYLTDMLRQFPGMSVQRDFVALRVVGTLDFSLVGVLARLTAALAQAGVSVFVMSTYQTDILLVRAGDAVASFEALKNVCEISPPPSGLTPQV